jgi:hypothetical protein
MHCVPSGNSREQGSKGQDPFDSPTKPSIVHCQAERQKAEPERSKHQPLSAVNSYTRRTWLNENHIYIHTD